MSVSLSYQFLPRDAAPPRISRLIADEVVRFIPHFLYIDLLARPIISGITDITTLFLKEEEVAGIFEGDFALQFPAGTGHNPMTGLILFSEIYDHIEFILDTNNPCRNGTASWNIPVILVDSRAPRHRQILNVVQEYTLRNRTLTVMKGGATLLEHQIPSIP